MTPNAAEAASNASLLWDWQFWSAVAAFLALGLSQFEPIIPKWRRGKLAVDVYSRLYINHFLGNPQAQLHLVLENVGGRPVKIQGMSLTASRGKTSFTMDGQNFLPTDDSKSTFLLTAFQLKPGEQWRHIVNFMTTLDGPEEKETRQALTALKSDLIAKRDALPKSDAERIEVEADRANSERIQHIFSQRFRWQASEYDFQLTVLTGSATAFVGQYRATVFESDEVELRRQTRGYAKGYGAILPLREEGIITTIKPA